MPALLHTLWRDISHLLYPNPCVGCGQEIFQRHLPVCGQCLWQLPATGYHLQADNPMARYFTGRIPVQQAAAWLFFAKGGLTQQLVHALKYKGRRDVGLFLGSAMATALQKENWLQDIDVLVPLPLNRHKLKRRGFNQSMVLCEGMAHTTGLPIQEIAVVRTIYTDTQTRKSRIQRWRNVADVFDLGHTKGLAGKHALLVDDVVTTGATLEACGKVLLGVPGLRLSVLSLAVASNI